MAPLKHYGDPASLHDIVLYTNIRHQMRTTGLARVLAEDIKSVRDVLDGRTDEQYEIPKLTAPLQILMTRLTTLQNLPRHIDIRYSATFHGLLHEIRNWIIFITDNSFFTDPTVKYLEFFIFRVVITQSGGIDRPKTILTVLEDSMFLPEIYSEYISQCFVEEKDLKRVANNVRKRLKEKKLIFPQLGSDRAITKKTVEAAITTTLDYYVPVSSFWNNLARPALMERASFGLCRFGDTRDKCASYTQLVTAEGDAGVIEWVLSRQSTRELRAAARFLLAHELHPRDAFALQYLAARLGPAEWRRLAGDRLGAVLPAVLGSWRWRRLAPAWWRAMHDACDLAEFRAVLLLAPLDDECYDEVALLLHAVWDAAPPHLRFCDDLLLHDLPALFALRLDARLLAPFLLSCTGERRMRLIARVTSLALEPSRVYDGLRAEAPELGLPAKMSFELNMESVKILLLAHHPPGNPEVTCDHFEELCVKWSVMDVDSLKRELVEDETFVAEYLFGHWYSAWGRELPLWCVGGDGVALDALLDGGILQGVYSRVVLESGSFELADAGLTLLQVNEGTAAAARSAAAGSGAVRTLLVSLVVEGVTPAAEWRLAWLPCLPDPAADPAALLAGILVALLRLDECETDEALREPAGILLHSYEDFIDTVLTPHSLCERIDGMLDEYGHPNARADAPEFPPGAVDERAARVIVDYRYRSFRALLHLGPLPDVRRLEVLPLTMLSQQLASRANLNIPVVV